MIPPGRETGGRVSAHCLSFHLKKKSDVYCDPHLSSDVRETEMLANVCICSVKSQFTSITVSLSRSCICGRDKNETVNQKYLSMCAFRMVHSKKSFKIGMKN